MAKAKERKRREKLTKKVDLTEPLLPIDIEKFGSDEDPCFGKLYDLTEDECKRCGDCTICGIVFNQGTLKLRAEQEKENTFKDLDIDKQTPDEKGAKKYIKEKIKEGKNILFIKKNVVRIYHLDKDDARKLIKKLK